MAAVKTGSGKGSSSSPKKVDQPKASPQSFPKVASKVAPKTPAKAAPAIALVAQPPAKNPGRGTAGAIYQLKIALSGSKPLIWRRILASGKMKLGSLHDLIQVAMGWDNSHMHLFRQGKLIFADSRQMDEDARDEQTTTLAELVPNEKGHFEYVYDFGDDWHHEIFVEQIGPASPGVDVPTVLGGENACPPEDCGGIPGYLDMLEVLKDPDHEEYEDTQEWIGDTFEPFRFDVKKANARLKKG